MKLKEINLYFCTRCHTVQVFNKKMTDLDRQLGGFNQTCMVCHGGQFFQPVAIAINRPELDSKAYGGEVFVTSDTDTRSPGTRPLR